ncbi:MAG: response regulator [Burkholderiaceae bacterium]
MTDEKKPLVLCVDDEPQILQGMQLNVRRKFRLLTATSGLEGLKIIEESETPAVVISDMRMPGMSGAEFLTQVRQLSPDSVRMLLTGYSDIEDTIAVVNDGQIFRFLTKPCGPLDLIHAIRDAVSQYELQFARKILLEQTLLGSVRAMMDMLSITNPVVFGQATRIRRLCQSIARKSSIDDLWKLEVASLMARMGWVTLTAELAEKLSLGGGLSGSESESVGRANALSEQLVRRIPQLDDVAEIIKGAEIAWSDLSREDLSGDSSRTAGKAQILRVVTAYDGLSAGGASVNEALKKMRDAQGQYDPDVLALASEVLETYREQADATTEASLEELQVGMRLEEDIVLTNGVLLAVQGYEITEGFMERLANFRDALEKARFKVHITKPVEA